MNSRKPLPVCAALGALFCTCLHTATAKPNVLVVLVDDLGWADLGSYGSTFHESPVLDALAAEGVRFTQAYSASPVCSPTRAALMTGRHPIRVDITDWIPGHREENPPMIAPEDRFELDLAEVTLGEVFKEHGYRTGYFGKWHLGEEPQFWPEYQGFDVNVGGFSKGTPPGGYYSPYKNPRLEDGPEGEYLTNRLTDEAIRFMREDSPDPFLIYLAFYNVHTPIQGYNKWDEYFIGKSASHDADVQATEPERNARNRIRQGNPKYAAMIRAVDDNVGRLLAELESLGIADETIVVFTSDNGGLSTRRSNALGPTSNKPLRSGKGWIYEGGIRVPLIIRAPGKSVPGSISEQPAISMDMMPTLLDLAGLPLRPDLHLDGISIVPSISSPDFAIPRKLLWHFPHYHADGWVPGAGIRVGDWKLMKNFQSGETELFNLAADPGEQHNLANSMPILRDQMEADLYARLNRLGGKLPSRP